MKYQRIPLVKGEYFHIYNRGNSKQAIFLDDEDRNRFVKLLYLHNSKKNVNFRDKIIDIKIDAWNFERGIPIVSIGAWVLMPNHFHLYLVSPMSDIGEKYGISFFIKKLCGGYVKYFNKKYNRIGSLFEGKFKAVHIENDTQAKYLFSYIHLNPIKLIDSKWKENGVIDKDRALSFLREYKWSSYLDFIKTKRSENKILMIKNFPQYFNNISDLNKEIFEWLSFEK